MFIVLIAPSIHRSMSQNEKRDYSEFLKIIEGFEEQVSTISEEATISKNHNGKEIRNLYKLKPFDPNTISLDELISMGFSARVSNTINNYRNSGGIFSSKEDLKKIYGITESIYYEIEPYIIIQESFVEEQNDPKKSNKQKHFNIHKENKTTNSQVTLLININEADSIDLTKLKGIGQVFSNRIIRYREMLGGFHCPEQLLEVFGMDTLRYNAIRDNIIADNQIRKININTAEFDELNRHPYITKSVANSIVMIRKQHGKYKSIDDIKKSDLIDDNTFLKIQPYLKVID